MLLNRNWTRYFNFAGRNIIAAEIEKVIDALASQSFSRAEFLKKLDRFYLAIEHAAATIADLQGLIIQDYFPPVPVTFPP